ncbi:MAG: PspC domain-containing protein [Archangium sp.]
MTETNTNTDTKQCSTCFREIDKRAVKCGFCAQRQNDVPSFFRNVPGRAAAGVCAALAQHFNWNVALVRVLFVASLAVTGGLVFWVYAALWAMTPFDQTGKSPINRLLDGLRDLFSPPSAPPSGVERVNGG